MAAKAKSPDEARAQQAAKDTAAAAAIAKKDLSRTKMEQAFGPNGLYQIGFDQYGNLILQQAIIDNNGKPTGEFTPVYLTVSADGKTMENPVNATTAVANIKKSYGKNLETLRKSLYERGYMSERDYITRSEAALNGAILKSGMEHSVEMVQRYTVNGITDFNSYASWLSGKPAYTGDTGYDTQKVSTPKSETDQDINAFFLDMLGRDATEEERTKYFNAVQLAEKNAKRKTTVSGKVATTTDTLLDSNDYFRIKASILKPSVVGTPLEKVTEGNGFIAQGVSELKAYAAAYGISRTPQQLLDDVLEDVTAVGQTEGARLNQQKAKIRTLAKARYANLANLIDEGVKVSDIANQFAYFKGQLLEIPDNSISIFDSDIQMALDNKDASGKSQGGVMSIVDYERMLRTDSKTKPLWLKTSKAREEASSYALDILRTFGLMA